MSETRPPGIYADGELLLPAADPDQLDADLAAELAYERARDAAIEAAREVLRASAPYPGVRWVEGTPLHGLDAALKRLDEARANYPYGLEEV